MKDILFPHDSMRNVQSELIEDIKHTIENQNHIVVHAPTGLGKTAATLPIALAHAIKNKLTVFFLTSRHTQHKIALDTLKQVKEKYDTEFSAIDIIGKKWMCGVPGVDVLSSHEFHEFCKSQREHEKCEFFTKCKSGLKLTPRAQKVLKDIKQLGIVESEKIVEIASFNKLCPYEMSMALAKEANVIICDYFHIFSETVRNTLFAKTDKEIGSSIVIVDEGHNLPNRVRELKTAKLSSYVLEKAIKEARKFEFDETESYLRAISDIFKHYERSLKGDEILVPKIEFMKKIELIKDYDKLIVNLFFVSDDIMEKQKKSFIFFVAQFLEAWKGDDRGFARIFSKRESKIGTIMTLSYRCLDPSLITRSIIQNSYSTILMSGTLNPTSMYKDILGFPKETIEKVFPSPFPEENRMNLVVPLTTTKYTERSNAMYKQIAEVIANATNKIPGNSAVFFPSYYLRDEVYKHFYPISKKTNLREQPGLTEIEKLNFLERFKACKETGAVLLGVSSGSYGEGIDLPGDLLKCVIVVGLPLRKPNLETKELIRYYDNIFNRGWDYGYLFPAFNKTLQSAGRCIRSETDRGVVIFLDQRYAWRNYYRCFPRDMKIIVTEKYGKYINAFFELSDPNGNQTELGGNFFS